MTDTSWHQGWYGYHPASDTHEAWGPEETRSDARRCPTAECDHCASGDKVITFFVSREVCATCGNEIDGKVWKNREGVAYCSEAHRIYSNDKRALTRKGGRQFRYEVYVGETRRIGLIRAAGIRAVKALIYKQFGEDVRIAYIKEASRE